MAMLDYVGVVAGASTPTSGDYTFSTTWPSGIQPGDLMVAFISSRGNAPFTAPAGWTILEQVLEGNTSTTPSSSIASGMVAVGVYSGSTPNRVFTRTGGDVAMGRIVIYEGLRRGAGSLDDFDVQVVVNTLASASTSVSTTTGITPTSSFVLPRCIIAGCGADNGTVSGYACSTDPTTGWTERADTNTTSGADTSIAVADAVQTSYTSTGTFTYTHSSSARHVIFGVVLTIDPTTANKVYPSTGSVPITTIAGTIANLTPKIVASAINWANYGGASIDNITRTIDINSGWHAPRSGSLLLCWFAMGAASPAENLTDMNMVSSGWTKVRELAKTDGDPDTAIQLYYKISDGSESTISALYYRGSNKAIYGTSLAVVEIVNADPTSPIIDHDDTISTIFPALTGSSTHHTGYYIGCVYNGVVGALNVTAQYDRFERMALDLLGPMDVLKKEADLNIISQGATVSASGTASIGVSVKGAVEKIDYPEFIQRAESGEDEDSGAIESGDGYSQPTSGNLLFLVVKRISYDSTDPGIPTITPPSGFVSAGKQSDWYAGTTTRITSEAFYKFSNGTETSLSYSASNEGNIRTLIGVVYEITNINTTTPIDNLTLQHAYGSDSSFNISPHVLSDSLTHYNIVDFFGGGTSTPLTDDFNLYQSSLNAYVGTLTSDVDIITKGAEFTYTGYNGIKIGMLVSFNFGEIQQAPPSYNATQFFIMF